VGGEEGSRIVKEVGVMEAARTTATGQTAMGNNVAVGGIQEEATVVDGAHLLPNPRVKMAGDGKLQK